MASKVPSVLRCPTSTSWRNLPCSRQRTSHRAQVVFRPLKTMSYPILSLPCCHWDQRICENQMWRMKNFGWLFRKFFTRHFPKEPARCVRSDLALLLKFPTTQQISTTFHFPTRAPSVVGREKMSTCCSLSIVYAKVGGLKYQIDC